MIEDCGLIRAVYRNFAKGGGGQFGIWTKEGGGGGGGRRVEAQ